LKNRVLLDNYYLPGDLERQITAFVEHYNHVRHHESIDNLRPADVYFDRKRPSWNANPLSFPPLQTAYDAGDRAVMWANDNVLGLH